MLGTMLQNLRSMLRTLLEGSGQAGGHRLRWWICFSGVLHLALILTLLAAPPSTARRDFAVPVYTVDLVAGDGPAPSEPEGARKPEPPRKQEAQEPVPEPAAPEPRETAEAPEEVPPPQPKAEAQAKKPAAEKKVAKPEKEVAKLKEVAKPEKVKPKKVAEPRKVAKRKAAKPGKEKVAARKNAAKPKKTAKPKKAARAKKAAKPKRSGGGDSDLVRRLKQRRIDAAVATARERAQLRRNGGGAQGGSSRGSGAGTGNGSGGVVRGMEFVAYFNQMLGRIQRFWTWPHRRGDLEVTVGFGVRGDGEVFGLELLKRSGNASFDESVVRAVRRASPLPPPPRSHAHEFERVEVIFRPDDLDGGTPSG